MNLLIQHSFVFLEFLTQVISSEDRLSHKNDCYCVCFVFLFLLFCFVFDLFCSIGCIPIPVVLVALFSS